MPRLADDLVQPFQVEPFGLRGRLVRLGPMLDEILNRHAYPELVAELLGEAITIAVALAGALKYDGVFTLQTKGDGPIALLVADVTTAGEVRGYAQVDEAKLAQARREGARSVPRLLGAGYLALTVDQGEHTERYQGIVELAGATLVECIHHYFRQSEQIEAALKVAVAQVGGSWRAGALTIQRLPAQGGTRSEAEEEGWRRTLVLMSSSTSRELVDPALQPEALLYRLFHEEGVRAWAPHALRAQCRCTRERVERMLRILSAEELKEMTVDGRVLVTCQFCSAVYTFDEAGLAALLAEA